MQDYTKQLSDLVDRLQTLADSLPAEQRQVINSQMPALRAALVNQQASLKEFSTSVIEYARRYAKDLEIAVQTERGLLEMLNRRLQSATDRLFETAELRTSFETEVQTEFENARAAARSVTLPNDVQRLDEVNRILLEISRYYAHLEDFWTDEKRRVMKVRDAHKLDPADAERWEVFNRELEHALERYEARSPSSLGLGSSSPISFAARSEYFDEDSSGDDAVTRPSRYKRRRVPSTPGTRLTQKIDLGSIFDHIAPEISSAETKLREARLSPSFRGHDFDFVKVGAGLQRNRDRFIDHWRRFLAYGKDIPGRWDSFTSQAWFVNLKEWEAADMTPKEIASDDASGTLQNALGGLKGIVPDRDARKISALEDDAERNLQTTVRAMSAVVQSLDGAPPRGPLKELHKWTKERDRLVRYRDGASATKELRVIPCLHF